MEEPLRWGCFLPTWPTRHYCWIVLLFVLAAGIVDGDGIAVRCTVAVRLICLLFMCVWACTMWCADDTMVLYFICESRIAHGFTRVHHSCTIWPVGVIWFDKKHRRHLETEAIARIRLAFFCYWAPMLVHEPGWPNGMFSRINRK